MVELPKNSTTVVYEEDGIVIDYSEVNGLPALHYKIKNQTVTKVLQPGGPAFGNSEVNHPAIRYWYDQPMHAWIIEHTPEGENDLTDTIFVPDEGEAYARRSKSKMDWSHTLSTSNILGAILVCSLLFVVVRFM